MAEPKKHTKATGTFNEDLIKYVIDSVFFPNDLQNGGGLMVTDDFASLIGDAKTYREARNRIISEFKSNPEALQRAISDFNDDYGNPEAKIVYNDNSYKQGATKMEPIKVDQMPIDDVNSIVQQLATELGFNDNGKESTGAMQAFLDKYYGGDGILKGIADAHSLKGGFGKESAAIANIIREKFDNEQATDFMRRMGYNPNIAFKEIVDLQNGLPAYAERAYRAYSRNKNLHAKAMSIAEGFVVPQVAASLDKGRNPSIVDVVTDGTEAALLGSGKIATKIGESVLKNAGIEAGLDFAHDAAYDLFHPVVYSEGSMPIQSRDFSDLLDAWRAANFANAVVYGGGIKGARAANKFLKQGNNIQKSKLDKALDEVNEDIYGQVRDKNRIESEIANVKDFTRARNKTRQKSGLESLTEKEALRDKNNELNDASQLIADSKRKRAAITLFKDLARIEATRGMYNPNLAPKTAEIIKEILNPKEQK